MLANPDRSKPPGAFVAMVAGLHDGLPRSPTASRRPACSCGSLARRPRAARGARRGARRRRRRSRGAAGAAPEPLLARLADGARWPERFALLDAEFAALAAAGRGDSGRTPRGGLRLGPPGGDGRQPADPELAREVGWSRRHLGEKFRAETGLAPKTAARLMRFERACDRLRGPGALARRGRRRRRLRRPGPPLPRLPRPRRHHRHRVARRTPGPLTRPASRGVGQDCRMPWMSRVIWIVDPTTGTPRARICCQFTVKCSRCSSVVAVQPAPMPFHSCMPR